ncbi:MAG: hypothetical protein AAF495_00840 [Pseudomonadota bacterium]
MKRLLDFPLAEPEEIAALRRAAAAAPKDPDQQVAFAAALSRAGCTYEAAHLLRPLRSHWKGSDLEAVARAALEAQSWWNKNWRDFAQRKQAGDWTGALALLGDRAVDFWDLPPLLIHLAGFAEDDGELALADHLYRRVLGLAERGLPKLNMTSFIYVAEAGLVEILLARGQAQEALARHRALTPNPGNAMAYELLTLKLLVATGAHEAAMVQAATTLTIAKKHRAGYSRALRLDFIEKAPELAPLRKRADWRELLEDPGAYLKR